LSFIAATMSAGRVCSLFVALLASALVAHAARAESRAHVAQVPLAVSARVVSTCSIDSNATQPVHCSRNDFVRVLRGAALRHSTAAGARVESISDGQFSITTIHF
jgi:hypothetical protein